MISCREVINLRSLAKIKVVAGHAGLDRIVRWVHFLDLPDVVPWVQGGELLFITGIGLNGDTQRLADVVRGIIAKKLAGLVIYIGPYIKETPVEVITLAEEAKFPVFELPWEVKLVEVTQEVCSFIVMKQTEERSLNDLLEQILFRSLEDPELLSQRAAYYGYDLSKPHQVAIINPTNLALFIQEKNLKDEKALVAFKIRFEQTVREILTMRSTKILSMLRLDEVILLLPHEKKITGSRYNIAILADIVEKLSAKMPGLEIAAGLGGRFEDLRGARPSYIQANKALRFAAFKTVSRPIYAYERLGIYKLLFEIEPAKLASYYQDVIQPLNDYDNDQQMELVASLFAYFEENGNAVKTARRLFVHRNTLDYRLKKVEEITGRNLNDAYDRLTLQLGVIIGKHLTREVDDLL
ncbi:MAG TPA: PucR family transcriptional regulator ligand-binding domain-containing protein [Methylomusa anaerophila]|uniref:Purine catabolism regulatory protein n=1 Tax=Methylomusa anaerophila TaxID=1930071 RepID=A0A348AJL6_9FIRM|nr:PucR family transcriptional regulator [Methylomusa anaerophila]BBB91264.1 purine catabolism regulatory protein [Methylomusa anaerophila]HML89741.1 PucR family transcriptional regulator ligand-binding domain-containing protein [Methylomusa anaerophila]